MNALKKIAAIMIGLASSGSAWAGAKECNNLFFVAQMDRLQGEINYSHDLSRELKEYLITLKATPGVGSAALSSQSEGYVRKVWRLGKGDVRNEVKKTLENGVRFGATNNISPHQIGLAIDSISFKGRDLAGRLGGSQKAVKKDVTAQSRVDFAVANGQLLVHQELLEIYDRLMALTNRECKLFSNPPNVKSARRK